MKKLASRLRRPPAQRLATPGSRGLAPTRRDILRLGGAGLGALVAGGLGLPSCRGSGDDDRYFRFAVLADTHLIDDFYTGPEGSPEDTESIFLTQQRLAAARAVINGLAPPIEKVFIAGDVAHNYPSEDWDFYFENETRFDLVRQELDLFTADVHPGLGNHDYDIGTIDREFTHDLVREKWGIEPYYTVEHKGWAFIHVNNFLGVTMDPASPEHNPDFGSLGATQLDWLEAELQLGRPTFIFLHFPLAFIEQHEVADRDLLALLRTYADTIQLVVAGHLHLWMDNGTAYGPPHLLCASTRYDPDAYMIIEADRTLGTHRILNQDLWEWYSHYAEPYVS